MDRYFPRPRPAEKTNYTGMRAVIISNFSL
jgi:hypothetical protein